MRLNRGSELQAHLALQDPNDMVPCWGVVPQGLSRWSAQSPSWEVDPLAISQEIRRGIHSRFHVISLEIPAALAPIFPLHAPSQKETLSLAQTPSSIPSSSSQ